MNSGKDYKHLSNGNIPVYGTSGYMLSVNKSLSNKNGIGIGRKGTIDKPQFLNAPFWTVDTLFYLTLKQKDNLSFFYFLTQKINWKKYDESTGVPSLSKATINSIKINVPNIDEQYKISHLLNALDNLITLYERKISKLLLIKKALSNDIFNGNIKFIINQNYKTFQLKKLLIETKKFSKIENEYPLLSSTNDGIKIRKGRVDSSSNIGYKIINKNELVLSPQNLWLGNINVNFKFKNGIVSPSYKIFKVKDGVDIFLLDNFLHNPKMLYLYKVVSVQGASVVRRNLDFDAFMNLEIKLPEKCVQKKLGSLLYTLDELINLYRKKHTNLKQIKK